MLRGHSLTALFIIVTLFSTTAHAQKPHSHRRHVLVARQQNGTETSTATTSTSVSETSISTSTSISVSQTSTTSQEVITTSQTTESQTQTASTSSISLTSTSALTTLSTQSTSSVVAPTALTVAPPAATVKAGTVSRGNTISFDQTATDSADIPAPTQSEQSFFQNSAAVAGVFSVVGIIGLAIVILIIMKVSKAVRRSREDDDDDEDFVIGESESSRQGHGGGGSMRSVASGLGPVVTDRAANFTMLVPGAGAPRHASYNYDPHNGNPFEDQHGPASIIPPSMAMAASRTAYRQPQPQPGQQFADPRQQEYLYPQQVSNYSPQPHPYAGQEHAPYQGQPQAHYNIDAYEDHQAYATSYSNHSYPELPPSSTARSSEDEFYQRGPLKVSNQ